MRKSIDKKATLPDGGTYLIGLGIARTTVPNGVPRISEQFVTVRATKSATPLQSAKPGLPAQ